MYSDIPFCLSLVFMLGGLGVLAWSSDVFVDGSAAVAKALGTGFRGFTTRDISVEPDALGRPAVRLSGGALERLHTLGAQSVMISITHTGGFAAAVAVIE